MTTFRYSLYGLELDSEIACPSLPPGRSDRTMASDVRICRGEVPEELTDPRKTGILFQAAPGRFLLRVEGVARYLLRQGRDVLVEPAAGADEPDQEIAGEFLQILN